MLEIVIKRCSPLLLAPLALTMATAVWANERAARSEPYDRSAFFLPGTLTSDDPRRIPSGPEPVAGEPLVITNARLFDGTGAPVRLATLVISGSRIEEILPPDSSYSRSAQVLDAAGRTVMPGLIDLHTHLTYINEAPLPARLGAENQADAALRGVERMRYYLESGVTSVRDVASHGTAIFRLKDWRNAGRIPGPRIFAAGQLITAKGGHGTENFFQIAAPEHPDSAVREASGPADWREAVREQFKLGADLIKLASHYSQEEVSAAVEEAHQLGLRVTVDAETAYIDMAIRAGVDAIEHPLPRSEEAVREMARLHIASVPTLVSYQYLIAMRSGYWGSTSRRFTLSNETNFAMAKKLANAGVKLGVGTDLVIDWYRSLPEPYIAELRNLESLGYTKAEALVAATQTSAEILGMDDRLGSLAPGMLADLILVDGKPDENLEDLANINTVIVNGRIEVQEGRLLVPRHEAEPPPTAHRD